MPLPDERKGNSVASILAKFQANVNDTNEAPLIPKARFGQAPPKQQPQQHKHDLKPPTSYLPPNKPVTLPSDTHKSAPQPTSPPTHPPALPDPTQSPPSSSPDRPHKPLLAPVITKPSVDVVPDAVPGSADKLLGVQVEGLRSPSSPQAVSGRLSAPGSPLCSSPPPVAVPFPSTEEPESPTGPSRRLSSVSAVSHASTSSALSARSPATPARKHSTAAAPTAASLAKTRPRVESTTKSPTRVRASPVLAASPALSAASGGSARTSPAGVRSKPATPKVGAAAMGRSRSGSAGSVSSGVTAVRKGAVPSVGTPRARAAATAKDGVAEAARKPRTSISPTTSRASTSANSTPASSKLRTSNTSSVNASPPTTRTSPLASRSAPPSKPGTPSSGRATPSGKARPTVAKPFSFGKSRKSNVGSLPPPDSALGLGISQSDSQASAHAVEHQSDAEVVGSAEEDAAEGQSAEASHKADEAQPTAPTAPTTPTLPASQDALEDEQPTPRAQRFEAAPHAPDDPPRAGKVFGGGAGGRAYGRIPIPMESDGEGSSRPIMAKELDGLRPEGGAEAGGAEEPAKGGKVFGGGAGGRPFGRVPIPMEDDGEGGLRAKEAGDLDKLVPTAEAGEE